MTPIHQLLSRIRWDKEFGRGDFTLGYLDRVTTEIRIMPLWEVQWTEGEPRNFQIVDAKGQTHRIPFHRVREVYKNGRLIWERPKQTATVPQSKMRCVRSPARSRWLRPRPLR